MSVDYSNFVSSCCDVVNIVSIVLCVYSLYMNHALIID